MILGVLAVRGREGPLAVFERWPDDASERGANAICGDRRCH